MNRSLLFLVFLLACFKAYTQGPLTSSRRSSLMTYVYKFTPQQVRDIAFEKIDISDNTLYTSAVDSFPTDSVYRKQLSNGTYCFLWVLDKKVRYDIKTISGLRVTATENTPGLWINIYDKEGRICDSATVFVDNRKVLFDPVHKQYRCKRLKNSEGVIVASVNEEAVIYDIEKRDQGYLYVESFGEKMRNLYHHIRFSISNERYHIRNKGFIVFNKPKYLPSDTVRLKAFITSKKGHPYTKSMIFKIPRTPYSKKSFIIDTLIHPLNPGSYVFDFPLNDSLAPSNHYSVSVFNKKQKEILDGHYFKVEDYQLEKNVYKATLDKKEYKMGDSLKISIDGFDVNRQRVLDGRCTIKLITRSIKDLYSNEAYVPDTLYSKHLSLDPQRSTNFVIPDSIFSPVNLYASLKVEFANSNNEIHDTTIYLTIDRRPEYIQGELINDSLYIRYFKNGLLVKHDARLTGMFEEDTIFSSQVSLPYKCRINPMISLYRISSGAVSEAIIVEELSEDDRSHSRSITVSGWRLNDTVSFRVNNPFRLEFRYRLYKNKDLIEQGIAKEFRRNIPERGTETYYLLVNYLQYGEEHLTAGSVDFESQYLDIEIKSSQEISPGDKGNLSVKVTDARNRPVENVNLTAWAINSQAGQLMIPDVPSWEKVRWLKRKRSYDCESSDLSEIRGLNKKLVDKFHLLDIPYYRFFFHRSGIDSVYEKTKNGRTEFAPYFIRNGYAIPISMISIGHDCVFNALWNEQPYTFQYRPGKYLVTVRTLDKQYVVRDVILKEGSKLLLSLNIDTIPASVKVTDAPEKYTVMEEKSINNSTLLINNYNNANGYILSDGKVISITGGYNSRIFKAGYFYKGAPLRFIYPGKFKTELQFEPGYVYTVREKSSILKPAKVISAGDPVITRVSEDLYANSLTENDVRDDLIIEPVIEYTRVPRTTEEGNGGIQFFNETDSLFVKYVMMVPGDTVNSWVFNPRDAVLKNLSPGPYTFTFFTASGNRIHFETIRCVSNTVHCIKLNRNDFSSERTSFNLKTPGRNFPSGLANTSYHFGSGSLKGKVTDDENGEALPFASVVLMRNGHIISSVQADFDGNFSMNKLGDGRYLVKAISVGYIPLEIKWVQIVNGKTTFVDIKLEASPNSLNEVEIVNYSVPMIDRMALSGSTVTREEFNMLATKNVMSVAATTAGVYMSDEYVIDGVSVRGSRAVPQSAIEQITVEGIESPETESLKPNVNAMRTDFRDYAFWVPDMITDRKGQASISFTYPDNITRWDGAVIAINGKRQTGITRYYVNAKKKVAAELAVPRFLIEGDTTVVIGKALNYTENPVRIHTQFKGSGKDISSDTILKFADIQKYEVNTGREVDTLSLSFSVTSDKFQDGEKQLIPVLKKGVIERNGHFALLEQDTLVSWHFDNSGEIRVTALSNPFDLVLNDLNSLKNYPYACNEQQASKLIGLLCEKKILKKRDLAFRSEKQIRLLIRKLENSQNHDGSWGWWTTTNKNIWITAYVIDALTKAQKEGYRSGALSKGINFLLQNVSGIKEKEILPVLKTLAENGEKLDFKTILGTIEKDTSLLSGLYIARIQQLSGMKIDVASVIKRSTENMPGGIYWQSNTSSFKSNSLYLTTLAYEILKDDSAGRLYLPKVRSYFFAERKNNGEWRNTLEVARISSLIVDDISEESHKSSSIIIDGKEYSLSGSPVQLKIPSRPEMQVSVRSSAPVYLTATQEIRNPEPGKISKDFIVKTEFIQNNKSVTSLKAGVPATMKVMVDVKKKAEYVMIEAPIPAGCFYEVKKQFAGYEHRDYFKNKTNIYVETMEPGHYEYEIELQPRFSGAYTLNPATVSLMYFPTFYGREKMSEVKVE